MASKRDYRDDLWRLISLLAVLMTSAVQLASGTPRWWLAVWIMVVATVLFCVVLACCWNFAQMCWLDNRRRLHAGSQDDPDALVAAGPLADGPSVLELRQGVSAAACATQLARLGTRLARKSVGGAEGVVVAVAVEDPWRGVIEGVIGGVIEGVSAASVTPMRDGPLLVDAPYGGRAQCAGFVRERVTHVA